MHIVINMVYGKKKLNKFQKGAKHLALFLLKEIVEKDEFAYGITRKVYEDSFRGG